MAVTTNSIRIRKNGKIVYVKPADVDPNPVLACEVEYVDVGSERRGIVHGWMAFDPRYGPSTEEQIEWHRARGTPGAETWEVGTPVPGFS